MCNLLCEWLPLVQGSAPARIKQEPRDDVAGTRLSEDEEDDSELRIALAR